MPYVLDERRDALHGIDQELQFPENAGELNYCITTYLIKYIEDHGLSYQTCNDIVGALDNAKSEFKRRIQDPYEDTKIMTNGDVGYGEIIKEHFLATFGGPEGAN